MLVHLWRLRSGRQNLVASPTYGLLLNGFSNTETLPGVVYTLEGEGEGGGPFCVARFNSACPVTDVCTG